MKTEETKGKLKKIEGSYIQGSSTCHTLDLFPTVMSSSPLRGIRNLHGC